MTMLQARNKGGWMFENVHNSIMVCLITRHSGSNANRTDEIKIWPSVVSEAQVREASDNNAIRLRTEEVKSFTDSYVIPWFSSPQDRLLFDRMRALPRLGSGKAWITGTADSSRWDFSGSGPHKKFVRTTDPGKGWRVLMTRHVEAYRINCGPAFQRFIPNPEQLAALKLGVNIESGQAIVNSDHPIIVFRYPSRNDDTRTLIATALPETGFLYSKGYVHGLRTDKASITDVLALLGYLNSFVCDWWVRRFADRHVTLPVLNSVPLPAWNSKVREQVALLVSALLIRGGTKRLPGWNITTDPALRSLEDVDLQVAIEKHVFSGFELTSHHFQTLFEDFSENAFRGDYRQKLER